MKAEEKQLLEAFRKLDAESKTTLQEFAEFLTTRSAARQAPAEIAEPADIPRPEEETVIKAVKRLSATYHMLDKSKMLNDTSMLVAQHTMQGRDKEEVIEELELVFERHYRNYVVEMGGEPGEASE